MSRFESGWLSVVGGASALALIVGLVSIAQNLQRPAPAPRIVTADYVGIVRNRTLELANRDLDDAALARASQAWASEFRSSLARIGTENNIIILPTGIGVYGAEDITDQLKTILGKTP